MSTASRKCRHDSADQPLPRPMGKLDASSGLQARIGIPTSDTPADAQKPSDVFTPARDSVPYLADDRSSRSASDARAHTLYSVAESVPVRIHSLQSAHNRSMSPAVNDC